jgi:hypothetical protein
MNENGKACDYELELVIGKYSFRPLVGDLDNLTFRKNREPGICGFRKLGPSEDTSSVSRMARPATGPRQRSMRARAFMRILSESRAPPSVAISCMAPEGMLKRIVVKLSKQKDGMIRGPKVEMPPLGMLQFCV